MLETLSVAAVNKAVSEFAEGYLGGVVEPGYFVFAVQVAAILVSAYITKAAYRKTAAPALAFGWRHTGKRACDWVKAKRMGDGLYHRLNAALSEAEEGYAEIDPDTRMIHASGDITFVGTRKWNPKKGIHEDTSVIHAVTIDEGSVYGLLTFKELTKLNKRFDAVMSPIVAEHKQGLRKKALMASAGEARFQDHPSIIVQDEAQRSKPAKCALRGGLGK
jgi:hypothetical protein